MAETKFKPVEEQLAYLKKGVAEIIPEADLKAKLENSLKTGKPLRAYLGVDPTAPDIHLGHTVVLRKLKHFQDLGHTAIFLIGDFSAMIGDPTGVSETRPPLTREQVDANAKTYLAQVFKLLDPQKTEVRYNSEWLGKMSAGDVVRLCSHYRLARLLEREDFRNRLASGKAYEEQLLEARANLKSQPGLKAGSVGPADLSAKDRSTLSATQVPAARGVPQAISVHELLYPLLTAYDAVALKSDVEIGATEQKFNILVHRDIQREYGLEGEVALTMPILVGLDGQRKMSKSLGNYIGITEPPAEIFGKIMSIPDDLMWTYYDLVTDRTPAEIAALKKEVASGAAHPMDVKMHLAQEVIAGFHGEEAARKAAENFQRVFRDRQAPERMREMRLTRDPNGQLHAVVSRPHGPSPFPMLIQPSPKWPQLMSYLDEAESVSEATRMIKQGGFEVDGQVIKDPSARLDTSTNGCYVVRFGKKQFVRIIVE